MYFELAVDSVSERMCALDFGVGGKLIVYTPWSYLAIDSSGKVNLFQSKPIWNSYLKCWEDILGGMCLGYCREFNLEDKASSLRYCLQDYAGKTLDVKNAVYDKVADKTREFKAFIDNAMPDFMHVVAGEHFNIKMPYLYKYITVDSSGQIYAWTAKPVADFSSWNDGERYVHMGEVNLSADEKYWKSLLVVIDNEICVSGKLDLAYAIFKLIDKAKYESEVV